jgi:hypothetical protein
MLERISLDKNLVQWRPERKTWTRRQQNGRQTQDKLSALTARFRNALKKSVEGIIEVGRVLIEAKNELEHGQFTDWVVRKLRFGTRKDGNCEADLRKAEMLMFLARNEVISNPCHWHAFPPSPRTLWELTQIRPNPTRKSNGQFCCDAKQRPVAFGFLAEHRIYEMADAQN